MATGMAGGLLLGLLLVAAGRPWRAAGAGILAGRLLALALFVTGNGFWAFRLAMPVSELALGWAGLLLWRQARETGGLREGEGEAAVPQPVPA